jgi:hypothetical protein
LEFAGVGFAAACTGLEAATVGFALGVATAIDLTPDMAGKCDFESPDNNGAGLAIAGVEFATVGLELGASDVGLTTVDR